MNVLPRTRLVSPVNTISSACAAGGRKRIFRRAFLQAVVLTVGLALGSMARITVRVAKASADDRKTVAALDTQYQAAVKKNDAATMERLLAEDFVLVTGSGKTYTKADLLGEARSEQIHYERQEDTDQTVRIWGDTAVVTAKLWEKGTNQGKHFDKTVWFSDTYVRTPTGWRYVFGQSSLPLPDNSLSTEAKAGQVSRGTNMREKRRLFPFWITGKAEVMPTDLIRAILGNPGRGIGLKT